MTRQLSAQNTETLRDHRVINRFPGNVTRSGRRSMAAGIDPALRLTVLPPTSPGSWPNTLGSAVIAY